MSHETENPLIIDVVGEAEPPQSAEQTASKKPSRSAGKRVFFKKEKATAGAATVQAASEAEVDSAKRAAAATAPPVQDPVSQEPPIREEPATNQQPAPSKPQMQQPEQFQPQAQAPSSAQVQQPVQPQVAAPQASQSEMPQVQPQAQPVQPQAPQPTAAQPTPPASSGYAPVPMNQPMQQGNMAAAVAAPQRSRAFFVFGILAVLVVMFALVVMGLYAFFPFDEDRLLVPTNQVSQSSDEVKPIVSASLDQASKVSLRATADKWNENDSTPVIAYVKRVEGASEGDEDSAERYFAFAPNQNASISLPAGRYAFNFIAPMNADGTLYAVPEMVNMVVGDGGMAVLPVDFTLIPKEEVTEEQVSRALAQLKTASEKGDGSLDYEPFKKSIDLALTTWFPQNGSSTEQPATDLTQEQQDALNAQADSQNAGQANSGSSSTATTEHEHDWIAQHEQRWQPAIVPVIDTAAWESPVYARYRCQEGILFETLDACLAHVRERGNEPYTSSNEIIRIDYHPAVVHYEERGSYEDVITGYRCSICGVHGTL